MSTLEVDDRHVCANRRAIKQIEEKCKTVHSRNNASQRSRSRGLVKKVKSAFMNRIITISYENTNPECLLPDLFMNKAYSLLQTDVSSFLKDHFALKMNIKLHAVYTQPIMKDFESSKLKAKIFKADTGEIFFIEDLENEFPTLVKNIIRTSDHFLAKEGGWTLLHLIKVEFNLNKYQPLKGSIYIPLPKKVEYKRACINVKNKDKYCFKWALLAAISNPIRPQRTTSYNVNILSKIIELNGYTFNFGGLRFPLRVKDVSIFEEHNPGISINVFGYDTEKDLVIGPYYKTKKKREKHINLLFFEDIVKKKIVGHYVWIKSFSRLIKNQLSANSCKVYVCDTCLKHYYSEKVLEAHRCGQEDEIAAEQNKCVLEFKNYVKTVNVPFVIYANYQCISQDDETCNPTPHIFTYFIKCSYDDNLSKWRSFKGSNALRQFAESLIKDAKYYYINYSIKVVPKIPLTSKEKLEYYKTNNCYICSREIREEKVKLHCRLTGKYKGPAHHVCALNYRIPKKFPVIFHNLSYYESILFIKAFNDIDDDPINLRPLNNDSSVCFTKDIRLDMGGKLELRFLNFCVFMPFSLDYLVQSMSQSDFKTLKITYPDNERKFYLAMKKCLIPYKYLNSVDKLTATSIPTIDYFYNTILDEECSSEDYAHAENIWNEFECNTLEDYILMCIKINVLQLTDIFENFRLVCKNAYNLDPCNYHSATEISWDAFLKMTDVKVKLLTEKKMISFIKEGMRGPISHCFQRKSIANNKYLCDYNDKLPSKYLMYFHANDLYGRVMSEPLPEGNFEWETDIENFSLDSIPCESKVGYILEVDLQYPNEIHHIHNTLPFCIENSTFSDENEEFSTNLNHKYNYIIYYKNLQQCLQHGLKLEKIHRILKFDQSDWLKKYIKLNKTYEADAKTPFEVNFFQLINNALYEKIMETVRKRIKIIHKWESDGRRLATRAYINKPEFSSAIIYDENTVAVELNTNPHQYMPIYLEFVISELTKLKMYGFHYEYMIPKYNTDLQLNYVDTDSLIYTITTNDLYKDITNDIYLMINTFDPNAINNNRLAMKTLGMMKDANDGVVLKEFLGLGPKLYSLKAETMRETNEDIVLENNVFISLSDYKNQLYNEQIFCDSINSLKSKLHHRYTKHINDLYFSYEYLDNNICTVQIEDDDDDDIICIE